MGLLSFAIDLSRACCHLILTVALRHCPPLDVRVCVYTQLARIGYTCADTEHNEGSGVEGAADVGVCTLISKHTHMNSHRKLNRERAGAKGEGINIRTQTHHRCPREHAEYRAPPAIGISQLETQPGSLVADRSLFPSSHKRDAKRGPFCLEHAGWFQKRGL